MILFFAEGECDSDAFVKHCYAHFADIMNAAGCNYPYDVEIVREYGEKPRFDKGGAHFSLSHSHGVLMLGISRTEIGVDEITPFVGQFSERRVVKPERLERIIVSAAKQSLKSRFPVLHPLCPFHELLDCPASQRFIAHCYPGEKPLLQHACHPGGDVLVLIGPEGDFSPDEVQRALACGFQPVSLGTSRLRTETAGVVAVATVQLVNN